MKCLWLVLVAGVISWLPSQASANEARIAYFRPATILTTYSLALEVSQIERKMILNEGGWPVIGADGDIRVGGCALPADQSEAAVQRRRQENLRLQQLLLAKRRERDQKIEGAVRAVAARNSLTVVLKRPALMLARAGDITAEILNELEQGAPQVPKTPGSEERATIGVLDLELLGAKDAGYQAMSLAQPELALEIARLSEQLDLTMVLDKRIVFLGGLDLTPLLLSTPFRF